MKTDIEKIEKEILNKSMNLLLLYYSLEKDENELIDNIKILINNSKIINDYLDNYISNLENVTEEEIRKKYTEEESKILYSYAIIKGKIKEDEEVDYSITDLKTTSSLTMYIQEIRNYPILDNQKILEYIKTYQENIKLYEETKDTLFYKKAMKARDICLESNLRLVVYFAKKYINTSISLLDLIEEGNLGLIKAIEKFDTNLETKFSTYAGYWINQRIIMYIKNQGKLIKIPINSQRDYNKYMKVYNDYQKTYGHNPSEEELMDTLGINRDYIKKLEEQTIRFVSLDAPARDDERSKLDNYNLVSTGQFEEDIINKETIKKLLKCLSEKEQTIIALRYGLIDGKVWSLKEIGEKYDITRERVRQIEDKILKKLRRNYLGRKSLVTIGEYLKKNKTLLNKSIKLLNYQDQETIKEIFGKNLEKPIDIKCFSKEPLLSIIKELEVNLNPEIEVKHTTEKYTGKRLLEIITREKFNELIKLNHLSIEYVNLTLVFGLNLLDPANFSNKNINLDLLFKTIDIKNNEASIYIGKSLQEITHLSSEDIYFYINEFGVDTKKYECIINTFGKKLTNRYLEKDEQVEKIINDLLNVDKTIGYTLKNKTLQEILELNDEDYYFYLETRKNKEYRSNVLSIFFGNDLKGIYNNEYSTIKNLRNLRISISKMKPKNKDLSLEKEKLNNSFLNKTLLEYLNIEKDELNNIRKLISKNQEVLKTLTNIYGTNLDLVYNPKTKNDEKTTTMQIFLKELKDKIHNNNKLKEMLEKLPIIYRLPIELYLGIYDGKKYSIEEIEKVLNIPTNEIKLRIKNGLTWLKDEENIECKKELTLLKSL